jgi:hypothetical protein
MKEQGSREKGQGIGNMSHEAVSQMRGRHHGTTEAHRDTERYR